jgi:hypothetical protein
MFVEFPLISEIITLYIIKTFAKTAGRTGKDYIPSLPKMEYFILK